MVGSATATQFLLSGCLSASSVARRAGEHHVGAGRERKEDGEREVESNAGSDADKRKGAGDQVQGGSWEIRPSDRAHFGPGNIRGQETSIPGGVQPEQGKEHCNYSECGAIE